MSADFNALFRITMGIIPFIKETVFLTFATFFLAMLLAILIACIVEYRVPVLYPLARVYSSFFRCTPLVAQLFFFYFGVMEFIPFMDNIPPSGALIITFGMNESAFMAETLRGALASVEKGQKEAALSVGMTNLEAMREIILPQALRIAIPSLSNSFIGIVKGTSIGFTIGVIEIMAQSKLLAAASFRIIESYFAVLMIYWIVIFILTRLQVILEKKMNTAY